MTFNLMSDKIGEKIIPDPGESQISLTNPSEISRTHAGDISQQIEESKIGESFLGLNQSKLE